MSLGQYAGVKVLNAEDIENHLTHIDVIKTMEQTFNALANGLVVQPSQTLTLFPENRGDFITYLGVLSHRNVFGAKLSPYIPTTGSPIITAWTMLMSMQTGLPLLLCDSGRLTRERTAAVTALAIDKLAPSGSKVLAVIGAGALAQAHIQHASKVRNWSEIRVYAPELSENSAKQADLINIDERVLVSKSNVECIANADVIMLCTSSGTPVISLGNVKNSVVITSISTNVANAHEVDPASLLSMDVYCDYKLTTPSSAGEMVLAAKDHHWSKDAIIGDLADLCAEHCEKPKYDKPVFFRSIGLGLEDIAIADAIYTQLAKG